MVNVKLIILVKKEREADWIERREKKILHDRSDKAAFSVLYYTHYTSIYKTKLFFCILSIFYYNFDKIFSVSI